MTQFEVALNDQVLDKPRPFVISVRAQICISLILIFLLCAKVWIKIRAVQDGYDLAAHRQEAVELDLNRRELELERSLLIRPDNLAKLAEAKLDLKRLDPTRARKVMY